MPRRLIKNSSKNKGYFLKPKIKDPRDKPSLRAGKGRGGQGIMKIARGQPRSANRHRSRTQDS